MRAVCSIERGSELIWNPLDGWWPKGRWKLTKRTLNELRCSGMLMRDSAIVLVTIKFHRTLNLPKIIISSFILPPALISRFSSTFQHDD